jgi:hypothetical protein
MVMLEAGAGRLVVAVRLVGAGLHQGREAEGRGVHHTAEAEVEVELQCHLPEVQG